MEETKKLGIYRAAEPLQPTGTATTIRMQGGKPVTLDGPFAETKETTCRLLHSGLQGSG